VASSSLERISALLVELKSLDVLPLMWLNNKVSQDFQHKSSLFYLVAMLKTSIVISVAEQEPPEPHQNFRIKIMQLCNTDCHPLVVNKQGDKLGKPSL
jgi:hypothetical protein